MSGNEPPQIRRDINLLAPSQNPQETRIPFGSNPMQVAQDRDVQDPWKEAKRKIEAAAKESRDRDLMRVFRSLAGVHPELAAEAEQKGIDLGIDARLAEADIEKVREMHEAWTYRAFLNSGGSEAIMRSMLDPGFARIARDDLKNLSVVDGLLATWRSGRVGDEVSRLHMKRAETLTGNLSEEDRTTLDRLEAERMDLPLDSSGQGLLGPLYGGSLMLGGMAQTMLGSAAMAGAGFFVAGPPGAAFAGLSTLGLMSGRQIGGEAYAEMRRLGVSHEVASSQAKWAAGVGGILEAGVFGAVGGKIAGKAVQQLLTGQLKEITKGAAVRGFVKGYAKTVVSETAVEVAQDLHRWGLTTAALVSTVPSARADLDLGHTIAETLRGVAILSVFGPALQFRNNMQRAEAAQVLEERVIKLGDAIGDAKLPELSPNRFMDYLAQAVEESGGPKALFFDLDTFTEQMQETGWTMAELEEKAPEVATQLRKAEADGLGVFEMPTATYGGKFLGKTDLGQALMAHARVEPDGMTAAEGLEFEANAEKAIEEGKQLLADQERTTEEIKTQLAEVKKARYRQLVEAGQPGKVATVAANVFAHKIAVLADRLALPPKEVAEKYFGTVVSEETVTADAEALDQSAEEAPEPTAETELADEAQRSATKRSASRALPEAEEPTPTTEPEALSAVDQLGKFIPETMQTVLRQGAEGANPSTVLHEMVHEYVNALLTIVAEGDAPASITAEVDVLMKFWKMEGKTAEARLAAWNAMSFEEQAPHQEAVSYNYELWLFNGTAPTAGLKRLFRRIRIFMLNVYTSLVEAQRKLSGRYEDNFGQELPGMTPELREMFERMVGGEQAAAKIEAVRERAPMFQTLEEFVEAGGEPARWPAYQQLGEDYQQDLKDALIARTNRAVQWHDNARGRVAKELQQKHNKRRREVKKEVEEQVRKEPIRQIRAAFTPTQIKAEPDAIAELFPEDFPTGRHLLEALESTPTLVEEIKLRTAQVLEERYGDPVNEEAIQDQVEDAVHSKARAKFVAAEAAFFEGATRPRAVVVAQAQETARRILGERQLNDISVYRFARLEEREGAAAKRAMKDGDYPAVAEHKNRELLYHYLARYALDAKEEIRKAKEGLFRRISRGTNDDVGKTRDVNRVQVARAVLSLYGLMPEGKAEATAELLRTMKEHQPEIFELFQPVLAEAQQAGAEVSYKHENMTLDQFRAMREMVDTLWFWSLRSKQIEIEGKKRLIDEVVAELLPPLEARARTDIPGARGAVPKTIGHKIKTTARSVHAAVTKLEHWTRYLDEGKQGPFTVYLYRQVKEALNRYRTDAVIYTKQFVEMLDKLKTSGLLKGSEIPATELGLDDDGKPIYTFGQDKKTPAMVELLGALLHVRGNESNKGKVLVPGRGGGEKGWADVILDKDGNAVDIDYSRWDAFEERMVRDGILTKEHYDFLQAVYDLMEGIKPLLQKAHVQLQGFTFPEVKAQPFEITFPDGSKQSYQGGYVPAGVDFERAKETDNAGPVEAFEAEMQQMKQDFGRLVPRVDLGMTKARIDDYRERPLSLDLGHILAHIDQSMRIAHVAPAVNDMGRLVNNKEFKAALAKVDPTARVDILVPFLDRAVTQTLYKPPDTPASKALHNTWKYLRRMTGIKIMSGNWSVGFQQFTGLSNAGIYVKPRYMKVGFAEMLSRPRGLTDEIAALSDRHDGMMADRLKNQMFGLSEDYRQLTLSLTKLDKLQAKGIEWGYILPATAQNLTDIATWKGAYEQGLAESPDVNETLFEMEKRAVREADQAVRLSQGSFSPEDMAGYEKGSAFYRTWTQFSAYFNTVLNQNMYAVDGREKAKAKVFGFMVPAIAASAITMTLYDRWEDEDDDGHIDAAVWRELFVWSQVSTATAMVPAIGTNLFNVLGQIGVTDRPTFGDRVVASPTPATVVQALVGLGRSIDAVVNDGEAPATREIRDAFSLAVIMGVPGGALVAPLIRPATYLTGIARGETEPTGALDTVRGLMTGFASKDSRR